MHKFILIASDQWAFKKKMSSNQYKCMTLIRLEDYLFPKTITATYLPVSVLSELEQMYCTQCITQQR